ncbi:MAG: MFS transporter [Ectothiorhodospiraceae bacterium]|nr:MFS transporter [Ectothiorhodospiraceae bacterium]
MAIPSASIRPSRAGSSAGPSDVARRVTQRVTNVAHVLHDGLVDMLYALLPVLAEAFGLSYSQVGLVRAANRTAAAALQLPAALVSERVGARSMLAAGTLLAGGALVALGLAESFVGILVCCVLLGAGGAVQHPLSSALLTEAFTGDGRRRALGVYNAFGDVGKFGFLGIAVAAVGLGIGWRLPVLGFALAALVVGLWLGRALHAVGIGDPPPARGGSGPKVAWRQSWGMRSGRGVAALTAIAALDSSTRTGFLTFVAFALIEKGVDTGWAGSAVLVALLGGMAGKYACGLLAERVGVVRTIAITEIWTALGILAVVALPALPAYAVLPLLGVALNGTSSVIYGTVGELIEDGRHARAYGAIYTLGSVCGIVAPLVYGASADLVGLSTTLVVVAGVVLVTLPLLPTLARALATAR